MTFTTDSFDALTSLQKSNTFEVGQILTCSWGYSMTLVEWYVVTRRTAKTVWVKRINGAVTGDNGMGDGKSVPCVARTPFTDNEGNEVTKSFRIKNDNGEFAWDSYHRCSLRIWDMKPRYYNSWD